MLTIYQSEKVAIARKLLQDVQGEIADTDIQKKILLGDAADACNEVLQEDLPDGYTPLKEEAWYSPEGIKKSLPAPATGDAEAATTGERILGILGWIAGTSLLSSALCACLALGAWGISEFKSSTGIKTSTDYAAETRGYRGLSLVFLSSTLICGVLGSVVGDAVYRGKD